MIQASFRALAVSCTALALASCTPTTQSDVADAAPVQRTCESLAGVALPNATITEVAALTQGQSQPIDAFGIPPLPTAAAYCRVNATLTPREGSSIRVEVWLPAREAWNGKFVANGNGGYGGGLGGPRLTMRPALHRGYVAAASDMGHQGDGASGEDASWALNNPIAIEDYGYRANHEMTQFARALIREYYGEGPRRSYFQGCSDGGREALMEAQRYPDDFDGIIAGAPANAWPGLMASMMWTNHVAHIDAATRIPDDKLALIQNAVMAQCDELDGVADGVLEDPRRCNFNPASLQCRGRDRADCLTAPQIGALRALYQGPRDPQTGAQIFPGYPVGGEATPNAWPLWLTGENAQHIGFPRSFFRNFVFNEPNWDPASFDFSRDPQIGDRLMGDIVGSDNPDLSAFNASGGKLILYHGWNDAAITPLATIQYYDAVRETLGGDAADAFTRLYMVPGMSHCLGGPGVNSFDMLSVLDAWVERGEAPQRVVAARYEPEYLGVLDLPAQPVRTRPICPYPQTAHYNGSGDTDDAANFTCRAP